MKYWLLKTEPSSYSIANLAKERTTLWTGIRNYQVRNFIRDEIKVGDLAIIYHSSTAEPAAVGIAEVVSENLADPTQFDAKSEYYYKGSDKQNPRWLAFKIKLIQKFAKPVTLSQLRSSEVMSDSALVKKGNRLSIISLTKQQYQFITK